MLSGVHQLRVCQQAMRSAHSVAADAGAGARQEPLQQGRIIKVWPVGGSIMMPRWAAGVHLVPSLCVLYYKAESRLICYSVVCCPVQVGSCCRVLALALTARHSASERKL